MSEILTQLKEDGQRVTASLRDWLGQFPTDSAGEKKLLEAIGYSLFSDGKRFRPVLSLWVGEALGGDPEKVMAYACAVEMIHTYSLIHDDLPCMDDDDERRGKPTNHKVFGEDFALLAGDALLNEAPRWVLQKCGPASSQAALDLMGLAGIQGMVGGQAADLQSQNEKVKLKELETMLHKKTGALIVASVRGAALISGVEGPRLDALTEFARQLGFAFQVADDILDFREGVEDLENIVCHVGKEAAIDRLNELSTQAEQSLLKASCPSEKLQLLIAFNRDRKK